MIDQPVAPVGANGANPLQAQQPFASLLKDSGFVALHNAFLLGWSITELKSRVQIAACTRQQLATTISEPGTPQTQTIDGLIKDIILADLTDITQQDIAKQVQQSLNLSNKALPTDLGDHGWLTSVLRAIFNRIVTLHISRFPDSSTTNTIYDLPVPQDPTYPYPFLHPVEWNLVTSSQNDYTDIGIAPLTKSPAPGNPNIDVNAYMQDFKLYDVTRRAINGLTLLLTSPNESLVPDIIQRFQQGLINAVFNVYYTVNPPQDRQAAVLKTLSDLIVTLLDAWDSYIRENYYFAVANTQGAEAGSGADSSATSTELELTAYQTGRALANLSWGASVILAPLESLFPPNLQNALPNSPQLETLTQKARNTWLNVFNDRDVNNAQYQMMALSTALDAAYYRINKNIKAPNAGDLNTPPNPNLPSQAIQAVIQSLDYWQRAIQRMCSTQGTITPRQAPKPVQNTFQLGQLTKDVQKQPPAKAGQPKPAVAAQNILPTSVVQQKVTPQTSPMLPTPSKFLNWDMSAMLRNELIQQSYVWQSLLLCQQGLDSFSIDKVTQKIMDEFMGNLEQVVQKEIRRTTWMWVLFGAIAVIIAVLLGVGLKFGGISVNNLIPVASITAFGALLAPFINGIKSRLGKLGSYFGSAGTAIEQALQDGYNQVLIEFDYLNHDIGITYPLVEFFVWAGVAFGNNTNLIKDGYDCLIQVFWTDQDRQEEVQRVVRAAFGPLGAFVGASLKAPRPTSRKPAP